MNRRGLLGAVLAASAAPAFVKAGILMPLWVPKLDWLDATVWFDDDLRGWLPAESTGVKVASLLPCRRGVNNYSGVLDWAPLRRLEREMRARKHNKSFFVVRADWYVDPNDEVWDGVMPEFRSAYATR